MLYEKYKPKKFKDIVGQDIAVKILENIAINFNKYVIHGMILSGPYGCGKTICATTFARMINCNYLCGNCEACKMSINDINSDIIILDGALNSGIDNIRQLIDRVKYAPLYLKYRIVIIEEAHMLSKESMDVLLLTLQDPPKNTIFIFTTTNLIKITNTLRSRCLLIHINKIEHDILFKELKNISIHEDMNLSDDILSIISKSSDNSLRQGISNLETIYLAKLQNIDEINKYLCILSSQTIDTLFIKLMHGELKEAWNLWTNIKKGYTDKALLTSFENLFNELRLWKHDLPNNISDIIIQTNLKETLTDSLLLSFFEILHNCMFMINCECKHVVFTFFDMITHVEDNAMISSFIQGYTKRQERFSTNINNLEF
jgi:DNA polymerase-3 subunit gamma/tau